MKLSVLFKRIQHAVIQMPELEEEMEIRGITCNSQKAEEDSLFVCIQGSRADGHDYIRRSLQPWGILHSDRKTGIWGKDAEVSGKCCRRSGKRYTGSSCRDQQDLVWKSC